MSKSEMYRQYADEALRWSRRTHSETERAALLDLAQTWAMALARENRRLLKA